MKYYTILIVLLLIVIGCKSDIKKETSSEENTTIADSLANMNEEVAQKEYEPSDEEVREFGIIEVVEDGGYPFFVVTVNFVERQMKYDFNLNIENITMNLEQLNDLLGKYATIYYTSELENSLSDMQYNGTSLFGEYAPEKTKPDWKKITGTLSGANEPTPGDLPGMITLTKDTGEKLDFEWYVDPEMVKANGKKVTAFYTLEGKSEITHIQPSESE